MSNTNQLEWAEDFIKSQDELLVITHTALYLLAKAIIEDNKIKGGK